MDNDHEKLLAVKEETEEKIDIENHSVHLLATYSSDEYLLSR
jgi:hypothetical protein